MELQYRNKAAYAIAEAIHDDKLTSEAVRAVSPSLDRISDKINLTGIYGESNTDIPQTHDTTKMETGPRYAYENNIINVVTVTPEQDALVRAAYAPKEAKEKGQDVQQQAAMQAAMQVSGGYGTERG